jgi:hypothetical protein
MASIDEIKKELLLSEENFFNDWMEDLQMFEGSYFYVQKLAGRMLSDGKESVLEDLVNGQIDDGEQSGGINTFPYGTRTRNIYPEFVGVCFGKSRLHSLFQKIEQQLGYYMNRRYHMSRSISLDTKKSITILVDKWDPKYLQQYEPLFFDAILNYNVYFNFYLVTDYGITRIPFINKRQMEKMKQVYKGQRIDRPQTYEELVAENGLEEMSYTIHECSMLDANRYPRHDRYLRYEFDFRRLYYYKYQEAFVDDEQENRHEGKIKKNVAMRFLKAAIALKQAGGLNERSHTMDFYSSKEVSFFEFSFRWTDDNDINTPERAEMIQSLETLVNSLEKRIM